MSDAISRAAAIDAAVEAADEWDGGYSRSREEIITLKLRMLPSAERPTGEWIKDEFGITVCSECKRPRRDSRVDHINFCNSCGARMINTK